MFDWLYTGLGYVIRLCYSVTNNYATALLLFAVAIKVLMFPLGIKQQKNMVKQAKLRPREMAIRKKYAGRNDNVTQQKMQQEIMNLYQEENFNPMGGCLPLLIQFPILWALYRVITQPLTYICRFSADTIAALEAKVSELTAGAGAGQIASKYSAQITTITEIRELGMENFTSIEGFSADLIPNFEIFGGSVNLAYTPSFKEFSLLLLIPLFTLVFTLLSTKITRKLSYQAPSAEDAANNASMKIMEYSMPLLSTYICFTVPATIGLYWIYQNVLSVLQTFIMSKMFPIPKFTEEDYKAAEKAVGADKKSKKNAVNDPNKPKVRSLHHIDDDEYEEIYGKKSKPESEKSQKKPVDAKEPEIKDKTEKEEAENREIDGDGKSEEKRDIPVIKDDDKTKYKKKD